MDDQTTPREDHDKTEGADARTVKRAYWFLGNNLTVLADHADTGGRYDLIESRQPPGDRTPPHRHTRYDERLYVVDGELTVWAGGREVVLRAGETFTVPSGTDHAVAATSEGATRALNVASPSGFARLIEEAGTPADAGGAPPEPTAADLERAGRVSAEIGDEILGPPGALPGA